MSCSSTLIILQWRHMSVKSSQIADNLTICSTTANNSETPGSRDPHYWAFVRGIHRWRVDSPQKGQVMLKAFPYYDIIMITHKKHSAEWNGINQHGAVIMRLQILFRRWLVAWSHQAIVWTNVDLIQWSRVTFTREILPRYHWLQCVWK